MTADIKKDCSIAADVRRLVRLKCSLQLPYEASKGPRRGSHSFDIQDGRGGELEAFSHQREEARLTLREQVSESHQTLRRHILTSHEIECTIRSDVIQQICQTVFLHC